MFRVDEPSPMKIEEQPERESQTISSSQRSSEGSQRPGANANTGQPALNAHNMMDEVMREISKNVVERGDTRTKESIAIGTSNKRRFTQTRLPRAGGDEVRIEETDHQREGAFVLGTQVAADMYGYLGRMKAFQMRARKELE